MWFDRLEYIDRGVSRPHGNFFTDPATICLVDTSVEPPVLTHAGNAFLAFRDTLRNNPLRAEYELLKALYFSEFPLQDKVRRYLDTKRTNLEMVLEQFTPAPTRHLFLMHPKLLAVAELVASFKGAIQGLLAFSEADLLLLEGLGESRLTNLCAGAAFPTGLAALCRRIGGDYTRAEERRLHYLVSMSLLAIAAGIPRDHARPLIIPAPYCNLPTEADIYHLHSQYTADITVWFDAVDFQVSTSLSPPHQAAILPPPAVLTVSLLPQTRIPSESNSASPTDQRRQSRRSARRTPTTIVIDPVISERAEDLVEERLLRPQYATSLVRAGHRSGETIALSDGMVPGADFYVVDESGEPIEFIEIKSVTGSLPFDVMFTRAENLRARRFAVNALSYRLILVDVSTGQFYEATKFASALATLVIEETIQIVMRIGNQQ